MEVHYHAHPILSFKNFISKLEKYSYYLATIMEGEYMRSLRFQHSTMAILKREYHLK